MTNLNEMLSNVYIYIPYILIAVMALFFLISSILLRIVRYQKNLTTKLNELEDEIICIKHMSRTERVAKVNVITPSANFASHKDE